MRPCGLLYKIRQFLAKTHFYSHVNMGVRIVHKHACTKLSARIMLLYACTKPCKPRQCCTMHTQNYEHGQCCTMCMYVTARIVLHCMCIPNKEHRQCYTTIVPSQKHGQCRTMHEPNHDYTAQCFNIQALNMIQKEYINNEISFSYLKVTFEELISQHYLLLWLFSCVGG